MNYLRERVSYLKGIAEGMQIGDSTNMEKLMKTVIDILDDIALAVDDMEEVQEKLSEQVDEIDESLAGLESVIFKDGCDYCGHDEDEDEDGDGDEDDEDGDEDEDGEDDDEDEDGDGEDSDDDDGDDDDLVTEFDCRHCGECITLEDAFVNKNTILCPCCHNEIELE